MLKAYLMGLIFQLENIQFFWKMDILSQEFLKDSGWVSPGSLPMLLTVVFWIAVQLSYVTAQDAAWNSLLEKIQFPTEKQSIVDNPDQLTGKAGPHFREGVTACFLSLPCHRAC